MNDDDDGRLNFYYSREDRLNRSSQAVRDFNDPSITQKKGFLKVLTGSQPLTFLFISLIIVCAAIALQTFLGNTDRAKIVGKNAVTVSAINVGDKSYITVKKTISGENILDGVYTGLVNIAVSLPNTEDSEETPVYIEQIYFTPEPEELFRFSVPFNGKKILMLMEAGTQKVLYTIFPA